MNRQTAHEMLKKAFQAAGLNGKLATHSLRKSFAQRVYEESGDIYLVQELLGHRNVSTTQKYIGVNYATARETVEAIALEAKASSSEPYRTDLLSRSLSCSHLGGELKAYRFRRNPLFGTRTPRIRPLQTPRHRDNGTDSQDRLIPSATGKVSMA